MLEYIITPVLGGIVGYFTNWLAIKMLFRPHEEKRICGIKVPFTPGLIFNQRYRLSKKIGQVTQSYILTNDVIGQYFSSEENKEKLYNKINTFFIELENKDYTFEELLKIYFEKNHENILNTIEENICDGMHFVLNNEEIDEKICDAINSTVMDFIEKFGNETDIVKCIDFIYNIIKENCFEKYITEDFINDKIINKSLSDLIDKDNFNKLEEGLIEKLPDFCDKITVFVESNVYFNAKLYELTKKVINENVGTFAGMFINSEKVYLSIKNGFLEYVNSKDGRDVIEGKIRGFLNENYVLKAYEIIDKLPTEIKTVVSEKISNKEILVKTVDDFLNYAKANMRDNKIAPNKLIYKLYPQFNDKIKEITDKLWKDKIKIFIIKRTGVFSSEIMKYIKKYKINPVIIKIKNYALDKTNYEKLWLNIIEKSSHKMIEKADIAGVIEDRINEFDMGLIEEISLSIVKKELNAITYFGGILGFVIGLIPVMINIFNNV